jgi:transposase
MIGLPAGSRIWLAAGITDMRRGMDGLASLVQTALQEDPFAVISSSSVAGAVI